MGIFSRKFTGNNIPQEVVFDEWLRRFCNMWLKEEFKLQIGADYYQRTPTRLDYSHGYYKRRLITKRGIINLDMPRARRVKLKYTLFERYKRYSKDFEEIVLRTSFRTLHKKSKDIF